MKIKLKLTSDEVSFEYMDTVPFIQGTDSRNKIYVYRLTSETPSISNMSISYQVQSGRYTLPLGNNSSGVVLENIDGVAYYKITFDQPILFCLLAPGPLELISINLACKCLSVPSQIEKPSCLIWLSK